MSRSRQLASSLGPVGMFSGNLATFTAARASEILAMVEGAGVSAVWTPEGARGKEIFSHAGVNLANTRRLVVASGIANIWARDPTAMASGARVLAEAYPGRFVLGLGVSHALNLQERQGEHGDYTRPLARMRGYLDQMDAADADLSIPVPAIPPPRVLAALQPRMLQLAAERALGAFSFFTTIEHTARARQILGPQPVLAVEQAIVFTMDGDDARVIAHEHVMHRLERENYRNHLLALGFTEADLAGSGSERLFDAIVAWGDTDRIITRVRDQYAAGADHVALDILTKPGTDLPIHQLRELTPAITVS